MMELSTRPPYNQPLEKVAGDTAARRRKEINADLDKRSAGVPADIWEAYTIKRIAEREQVLKDEATQRGEIA